MIKLAQLKLPLSLVFFALSSGLLGAGCASDLPRPGGACIVNAALDCTATADPKMAGQDVGLIGYTCSGSARPDQDAHYEEGIPRGTICADRGPDSAGQQTYCCSSQVTSCAYDPGQYCLPGTFGYQCRGASRPDVFNAKLNCSQGVPDDPYIEYCCTGQTPPPECTQKTGKCTPEFTGFNCPVGTEPLGSDLKSSESHADNYRFLCQNPTLAADNKSNDFCCYMAAPVPEGSSCLGDLNVPNCGTGRFGFACTGVDTPDQSYLPMICPDKGVPGISREGYPATLYCCDHK